MMYFMGTTFNEENILPEFITHNGIYIGCLETEDQTLLTHLLEIKISDFIVAKTYSPSKGLYIRAIGICTSEEILIMPKLGKGRRVKWLWEGNKALGIIKDHYNNMRTGALYSERNNLILKKVLELVTTKFEDVVLSDMVLQYLA